MICGPEPTFRLLNALVGWEDNTRPLHGRFKTHHVGGDERTAVADLDVADADREITCNAVTVTLLNGKAGDGLFVEEQQLPQEIGVDGSPGVKLEHTGQLKVSLSGLATLADYKKVVQAIEFDSIPEHLDTTLRKLCVVVKHDDEICLSTDAFIVVPKDPNRDGVDERFESFQHYCQQRDLVSRELEIDEEGRIQVDLITNNRVALQFLAPYLSPAWLALGSHTQDCYACGSRFVGETESQSFILLRDQCATQWCDLLPKLQAGDEVCNPIAIAVGDGRLVVLDLHDDSVRLFVWSVPDGRLCGKNHCRYVADRQYALSITPWRAIVAVHLGENGELRFDHFDLSGQQFRAIDPEFTHQNWEREGNGALRDIELRLARGRSGELFLAAGTTEASIPEPVFHVLAVHQDFRRSTTGCDSELVLRAEDQSERFASSPATIGDSICSNGIRWEQDDCVAIDVSSPMNQERIEWICRSGSLESRDYKPIRYPSFCGEVLLGPVTSFMGRCIWHRIRAEVVGEDFGELHIDVQSSDSANPADLEPSFWQEVNKNAFDFLIDQPAAEHLFLRLRMMGGLRSPVLSQLRIDFPRATSLDLLPAVYRQDPRAEDFTARFLSLFDAELEHLDHVIENLPSRFDVDSISSELLPWLASFLAIGLDESWGESQRRQILNAAPSLYEHRGTIQGLKRALGLVAEIDPEKIVIIERSHRRCFGIASHNARLGQTRLFGKRNSRMRLGTSPLGVAGLNTYGNPDEDFVRQDAHRFDVMIPPLADDESETMRQIESVVENLKPAHTQHTLRMGGEGFILGHRSVIGIDTKFVAPGEIVLANPSQGAATNAIRLGEGVLRPGPNRPTSGMNLGVTSNIGIHTTLE